MEVQKALNYNSRSTANYAVISRNKTGYEVSVDNESPWKRIPWSDDTALKDVEYNIIEGILYIKGTQIFYYNLPNILGDSLTAFGKRCLFALTKNNDKLVTPFIETDIVIHRWWRKNKIVRGVDLTDKILDDWYLSKIEKPCEVALSNFKLIETWKETTQS